MFRRTLWVLAVSLLLATVACGGGGSDLPPAGDDPTDPTPEPTVPKDGFGDLSGDCGLIDAAALDSASPALLRSAIDFGTDPYDAGDYDQLSPGGQTIVDDGPAGSSLMSEVFAYEVLYRCEDAALLKTGDEITYLNVGGKKTDLLVSIDGRRVGVSVTRAVGFPPGDPYTLQQAEDLLEGKLNDIAGSSANVAPVDAWSKQVLCLVAYAPEHADMLEAAYATLDASVRGDTIVQIIVTNGDDAFLY